MSFYVLGSAVLLGIAALLTIDAVLRVLRGPVPANFGAMLARRGIGWQRIAELGALGEAGMALDRCAECRAKPRCDEWLAAQNGESPAFCPNARFFERLKDAAHR
jgi:hypothetical protein